jgi:anti-sigma factor RsiW
MDDADDPGRLGLKDSASYYRAPATFARRLRKNLRASTSAPPRLIVTRRWWAFAASFACGAVLAWAVTYGQKSATESQLAHELVAGHVRSLMESHLTDVASTDQHTVKPWFAGKLDFSPPVVTDAAAGFTLVGGRMDYVGQRPVAALVYRVRGHLINVFIWPASNEDEALQSVTQQGYELVHLVRQRMNYWLVSDLNRSELSGFADALAKAAAQN